MSDIITMLSVEALKNHPDNPRKKISTDMEELVGSIKANGILQPMTVIPARDVDLASESGEYVVLIGHRRLDAAKQAGLTEVPCVIKYGTTKADQIKIMLLENMVRKDLTIKEQADSFKQLHLDLGMSVKEIAEKAGFSEPTVRHRIRMADLDSKLFEKASKNKAVSIEDFTRLEEISDPELKNQALRDIGTNNFKNAVEKAKRKELYQSLRAEWVTKLEGKAEKLEEFDFMTMTTIASLYEWNPSGAKFPELSDDKTYYYTDDERSVAIYAIRVEQKSDIDIFRENAVSEAEELKNQVNEKYDTAAMLRKDFIKTMGKGSQELNEKLALATFREALEGYRYYRIDKDFKEMLGLKKEEADGKKEMELFSTGYEKNPTKTMFAFLEARNHNRLSSSSTYNTTVHCSYPQAPMLEPFTMIYTLLEKAGYELSDGEKDILNGLPDDYAAAEALSKHHEARLQYLQEKEEKEKQKQEEQAKQKEQEEQAKQNEQNEETAA